MGTLSERSWWEHRKPEAWGLRWFGSPFSLAALLSNLLPLEENDCCCWEWLLRSASSWGVPPSCLLAAGSSWVQQRRACCSGPGALQGRVCESPMASSYQMPVYRTSPGLLSSPLHILWSGYSGQPMTLLFGRAPNGESQHSPLC